MAGRGGAFLADDFGDLFVRAGNDSKSGQDSVAGRTPVLRGFRFWFG